MIVKCGNTGKVFKDNKLTYRLCLIEEITISFDGNEQITLTNNLQFGSNFIGRADTPYYLQN